MNTNDKIMAEIRNINDGKPDYSRLNTEWLILCYTKGSLQVGTQEWAIQASATSWMEARPIFPHTILLPINCHACSPVAAGWLPPCKQE